MHNVSKTSPNPFLTSTSTPYPMPIFHTHPNNKHDKKMTNLEAQTILPQIFDLLYKMLLKK